MQNIPESVILIANVHTAGLKTLSNCMTRTVEKAGEHDKGPTDKHGATEHYRK